MINPTLSYSADSAAASYAADRLELLLQEAGAE